jgi:fumarylacetoacetate (FAA) hydrolase
MRICMFHPLDHPLERGWVGRVEGDRVIQLAAQTLQSLFTGGGSAREHAEYPLAEVRLLAPVLHPPAVRIFEDRTGFAFANPAAIVGPGAAVLTRHGVQSNSPSQGRLTLLARVAGVIGADGAVAGFTAFADWCDLARAAPKDRDFALGLGPVVVTPDEFDPGGREAIVRVGGVERARGGFDDFDWDTARDLAADRTRLYPGDLLVGPPLGAVDGIASGEVVELEVPVIGVLEQVVSG